MSMELIPEIEEPEEDDTPRRPIHRTKPLYAIDTPEERESWRQAYAAWGEQRKKEASAATEEIEVMEPGKMLPNALSAPGAPGLFAARLSGAGWDVKASRSLVAVPATYMVEDSAKSGKRKGDLKAPAHQLETLCILGSKRGADGVVALAAQATWMRKVGGSFGFQGAVTQDPILGREWRSTIEQPRAPREWEVAEGVAPPWGLDQWLWVICPNPCHYCGVDGPSRVYVVPLERGGEDSSWNRMPACRACAERIGMSIEEAHCKKCSDAVQKHRDIREARIQGVTLTAYLKLKKTTQKEAA